MKSRLIASVALSAVVLLGTTGCSMISPQATTIAYAPSDGITIEGTGPLELRNVMIVANDEGTAGNLIAAIVNDTDETQTLTFDIRDGEISDSIRVPARSVVSLGTEETEPLLIEDLDAMPGSDLPIYFSSGGAGSLATVPILDGGQEYLSEFVPESSRS